MVTVAGIDPGASGGIAVNKSNSYVFVKKFSPKDFFRTTYHLFKSIHDMYKPDAWYLEQVQGYIGQPHPGATMFAFGQNYGALEAFLVSLNCHYVKIAPNVWQRALQIKPRGLRETRWDFKKRLARYAHELFPNVRFTNDLADAMLITHLGYLLQTNQVTLSAKKVTKKRLLPYV